MQKTHTFRFSDEEWEALGTLATRSGFKSRQAYIRALAAPLVGKPRPPKVVRLEAARKALAEATPKPPPFDPDRRLITHLETSQLRLQCRQHPSAVQKGSSRRCWCGLPLEQV